MLTFTEHLLCTHPLYISLFDAYDNPVICYHRAHFTEEEYEDQKVMTSVRLIHLEVEGMTSKPRSLDCKAGNIPSMLCKQLISSVCGLFLNSYPVPTWLKAMLRSRPRVIRLHALVPPWLWAQTLQPDAPDLHHILAE